MLSPSQNKQSALFKKPEIKVYGFYSEVAKKHGITTDEVRQIYEHYMDRLVDSLKTGTRVRLVSLGEFRISPRKLRVRFFSRLIEHCRLQEMGCYEKIDIWAKEVLEESYEILEDMAVLFEQCVTCNRREHIAFMCLRNVVGNIYRCIDRLKLVNSESSVWLAEELQKMYEIYADRLAKKAEEIGAYEFMEAYKQFVISVRPHYAEHWGTKLAPDAHLKFTKEYATFEELETIYKPEYDVNNYIK